MDRLRLVHLGHTDVPFCYGTAASAMLQRPSQLKTRPPYTLAQSTTHLRKPILHCAHYNEIGLNCNEMPLLDIPTLRTTARHPSSDHNPSICPEQVRVASILPVICDSGIRLIEQLLAHVVVEFRHGLEVPIRRGC